jgi:hypothetical protein
MVSVHFSVGNLRATATVSCYGNVTQTIVNVCGDLIADQDEPRTGAHVTRYDLRRPIRHGKG